VQFRVRRRGDGRWPDYHAHRERVQWHDPYIDEIGARGRVRQSGPRGFRQSRLHLDISCRDAANFENSYDLLNKWRYVNRGRASAQVTEPRRFVVSRCDIDAQSVSDREPSPAGTYVCVTLQALGPPRRCLRARVPQADPLTAMGVVDSNMVVEHDSRRKPFLYRALP